MPNVLVTGANGFVGTNLCVALRRQEGVVLSEYGRDCSADELQQALANADIVLHLAGVNRPRDVADYEADNTGFTVEICSVLRRLKRAPKIVFASSIQAEMDNPYGLSKRKAEDALRDYAAATGAEVVVYRLKNLFGKWCKSDYNSVTATFCDNIAHDRPIVISDPAKQVELTYIDDVVRAFLGELSPGVPGFRYAGQIVSYRVTLGALAETIREFREMHCSPQVPDFSQPFIRALYATYASYLDRADLGYPLAARVDARGSLAEFIKAPGIGQIFVSRTHPGMTRGNHYHQTKVERFLVLQGEAVIRVRHILETQAIEYRVRGEDYRVVDIPPGYTHSIQTVGDEDVVTLFWADEVFDPRQPDTFSEPV